MKYPEKIGIVTVLYKSESVLNEFFCSLSQQMYDNFILYVIDNNSPDSSLNLSKQLAEKVSFETKFIENNDNYGVAKGNNQGIEAAINDKCDYVLLSNNDVTLKLNAIERLYIGLKRSNADMAVPKIYYYGTRTIWAAGGRFRFYSNTIVQIGQKKEDKGQFDKNYFVSYAPTCFMLIKIKVFAEIGLMDEKYFVYGDDCDFIYRAVKKAKKRLVYIYNSTIEHNEGTSTGGALSDFFCYYVFRNRVYFAKKYKKNVGIYFLMELLYHYTIRRIKMKKHKHQWKIIRDAFFAGLRY